MAYVGWPLANSLTCEDCQISVLMRMDGKMKKDQEMERPFYTRDPLQKPPSKTPFKNPLQKPPSKTTFPIHQPHQIGRTHPPTAQTPHKRPYKNTATKLVYHLTNTPDKTIIKASKRRQTKRMEIDPHLSLQPSPHFTPSQAQPLTHPLK
ncbi:hypothetical protein BJ508DRAFT_142355 [Ascobolus immersus RN42]|uniref:Uncharacterized protein n=1 Tax=Ascobolus immersus RN42 TaxID=1160509 RepID=A0A3N4HZR0_ASCIM|nr:hypothetical protein BJ508DRAFT_142355 [Ascobolus immersus RN42]